jgi:hypothetical protein
LNTTFFGSTRLLTAPNRLKSLKLAWRFVLTSCDIYQNPLTGENSQILTVSNKKNYYVDFQNTCTYMVALLQIAE